MSTPSNLIGLSSIANLVLSFQCCPVFFKKYATSLNFEYLCFEHNRLMKRQLIYAVIIVCTELFVFVYSSLFELGLEKAEMHSRWTIVAEEQKLM